MKKIKEFSKKNLIVFVIGITLLTVVGVKAITYFPSNQVTYDNSVSGLKSTEVQSAIDELYTKAQSCASNSKYSSFSSFSTMSSQGMIGGIVYSDDTGIYMISNDSTPLKMTSMTAKTLDVYAYYNGIVIYFSNEDGIYELSSTSSGLSEPSKISNIVTNDIQLLMMNNSPQLFFSNKDGIYIIYLASGNMTPQKVI